MLHQYCKLCLQPVLVSNWKSHTLQKQHLQQLPCKIIVKGCFTQDKVDQAYEYFGKFGGIRSQNVTFHEDGVAIEYRFWDARVYSEVIHQEHILFDQHVEISWHKKIKSGPMELVTQDERMNKEKFVYRKLAIINELKGLSTFTEQIKTFQNRMNEIKNEMEKKRKKIQNDLTTALSSNFHHNKIHFFGSVITQLDIYDSNLNMYLDGTDSEVTTLESLKDLISKSGSFANVYLNTETDLSMKFQHTKTDIFCELSIKSELPIGNSELIKYYLTLDEKLRDLMLLIKFWADCYGLRGGNLFSSYSLYVMVVFYLQQEPYKLPSVSELQKDLPPDEIDGWNCAFGPVEFTNPHLENSTILELITGFFRFYGGFDYISQVISPYFGSTIDKTSFINPQNLPECFEDYKNQNNIFVVKEGICVQDFFEHSKNVSLVSVSCSGKFTAVCRHSLQLVLSDEKQLLCSVMFCQNNDLDEFCLVKEERWDEAEWIVTIKGFILRTLKEIYGFEVDEIKSDEASIIYSCRGENKFLDESRIEKNVGNAGKVLVVLKFESDPSRVNIAFQEYENLPVLHIEHYVYVMLIKLLTELESIKKEKLAPMETDWAVENSEIKLEPEEADDTDECIFVALDEVVCAEMKYDERSQNTNLCVVSEKSGNTILNNSETVQECGKSSTEALMECSTENTNEIINLISPANSPRCEKRDLENDCNGLVIESTSCEEINIQEEDKSPTASPEETEYIPDFEAFRSQIKKRLSKISTFESQVFSIVDHLKKYNVELSKKYQCIHDDLTTVLTPHFPQSIIRILPSGIFKPRVKIYVANITEPEFETFAVIKKTIVSCGKFFEVITPDVKKPKTTFIHTQTKIDCELITRSKVRSMELVNYYLDSNHKIRTAADVIQVWASFHGANGVISDFLYIFMIFYLQVTHGLPSVAELQKNVAVEMEDGWNCAFDHKKIIALKNETIYELIEGFFNFYEQFDYVTYVVCPYLGRGVERTRFLKPHDLPEEFQIYASQDQVLYVDGMISVQDPFEHTCDLAFGENPFSGGFFTQLCRNCIQLFSSSKKQLLNDLLFTVKDPRYQDSRTFDVNKSGDEEDIEWCSRVKFAIIEIFTKVLNCTVQEISVFPSTYSLIIQCKFDVFTKRTSYVKSIGTHLPTAVIEFEKDVAATKHIVQYSPKEMDSNIYLRVNFLTNPCRAKFFFTSVCKDGLILHLENFVKVKLEKFLEDLNEKEKSEGSSARDTQENDMGVSKGDFENLKNEVRSMIRGAKSFTDQISILLNTLEIQRNVSQTNSWKIHKDLSLEMNGKLKNIIFYGSNVSDLNTSYSTVDIFIELNEDCVIESFVDSLTESEKFFDIKLQEEYGTPVVKCSHVETGLKCNINMTNRICLRNSAIIKYYANLDKKIHQLLMFVRFWADCHHLNSSGNFSNYALYLMVIFFLQQPPYGLPPVIKVKGRKKRRTVDEWKCSSYFVNFESPALQSATILQLVSGFFKFYGNFDYFTYVVSPYSGLFIEKTSFLKPYSLPGTFQNIVHKVANLQMEPWLCIQDPLEHSRNVVSSVPDDMSGKFASLCRICFSYIKRRETDLLCRLMESGSKIEPFLGSFAIDKCSDMEDGKWIQHFDDVFSKICKEILHCEVQKFRDRNGTVYLFSVKPFRPDSISLWKDTLKRSQPTSSDWSKNTLMGLSIFDKSMGKTMDFQVVFKNNPSRMVVYFPQKARLVFHYVHLFYTRLIMFLEKKQLLVALEGTMKPIDFGSMENVPFAKQVDVFQTQLQLRQEQAVTLHQAVSDDLSSILKPSFPETNVFLNNESLDLPQQNLSIYLSNISSSDETLNQLANLLFGSSKFNQVCAVPEKEIITFRHVVSKVSCTLSVKNKLPVCTSDLIKFYASLDPNVSSLMTITGAWVKLVGLNFPNHVLCLMVIFFLQHEYKIPSVEELQRDIPVDLVEGWNCAYKRPNSAETLKNVCFFDLLSGFLEFYATFNYSSIMICPYLGSLIRKARFLKPFELPECYQNYIRQNEEIGVGFLFTVQDPFNHCINVAQDVSVRVQGDFAYLCHRTLNELKSTKSLRHILNSTSSIAAAYKIEKDEDIDDKEWKEKVTALTLTILRRVFGADVAKISTRKSSNDRHITYNCGNMPQVCVSRSYAEKSLSLSEEMSDLDREIAVTSVFGTLFTRNAGQTFTVHLEFFENPYRLILTVNLRKVRSRRNDLAHLLYVRLLNALKDDRIEVAEETPSVKFDTLRTSILGSLITVSSFDEQVAVLQEQYRESNIDEYCTLIEADMKLLAAPLSTKEIVVSTKIINFNVKENNLDIYLNCESTLEELKDVLLNSESFCDSTIITSSFVRSKHAKTKIICDISITNKFSRQTSQLINYYLNLNDKLRPMMTFIRFWADSYRLTGAYKLTDSVLYILVIFFLQHKPYNLPSVAELQKGVPPILIDGWNCSFACPEFLNPALQKATVKELVVNFFKFYAKFDYISYAISPYFGAAVEKTRFLKPYDLPECYKEYVNQDKELVMDASICIQDFFEHTRTISPVLFYLSGQFAILCQSSLRAVTKEESKLLKNLIFCNHENFVLYLNETENVNTKTVFELVKRIFVQVFGCRLSGNCELENITLTGKYNIWNNRIKCLKNVEYLTADKFDREVAATECMIEDSPQESSWEIAVFVRKESNGELGIFFSRKQKLQIFQIMHFVYVKLLEAFPELGEEDTREEKDCMEVPERSISGIVSKQISTEAQKFVNEDIMEVEQIPSMSLNESTSENFHKIVESVTLEEKMDTSTLIDMVTTVASSASVAKMPLEQQNIPVPQIPESKKENIIVQSEETNPTSVVSSPTQSSSDVHQQNISFSVALTSEVENFENAEVEPTSDRNEEPIETPLATRNEEDTTVYVLKADEATSVIDEEVTEIASAGRIEEDTTAVVLKADEAKSPSSVSLAVADTSSSPEKLPNTSNGEISASSTTSSTSGPSRSKFLELKSTMNKKTFDEQISYYAEKLLVNEEKIEENKKKLRDDLTKLLTPHFTFDKIFFIGSSLIGLFTEESNFNIYIDKVEKRPNFDDCIEHIIRNSEQFFECYFSVRNNTVQCRHRRTQISCEIDIQNKMPMHGSLLINYYLTLDPKLRLFMFFMKCWADFYNLKTKALMSTYSMYLMVIFYLQQEPYKLPSVADLQKNAPLDLVNGWNVAFETPEFTNSALKDATILDLITGFFQFYASFDYFSNVIAPFSGCVIDKTCFLKLYQLPKLYANYMKQDKVMCIETGICVQDFFNHSLNVTFGVNLQSLGRFTALCRSAVQLISSGEEHLLYQLLSECQFSKKVDYHSIEIEKPSNFALNQWFLVVKNLIFVIITEVLCCNIINVKQEVLNRSPHGRRVGRKLRTGDVDKLVYVCVGQRNVWDKRVNILKAWMSRIFPHASCVDKDVFVSRLIAGDVRRILAWDMGVEVHFMTNPGCVRLRIFGDKKLFITHFFYTRILSVTGTFGGTVGQAEPIASSPFSALSKPYKVRIILKGWFFSEQSINLVHGYFSKFGNFENCNMIQDKGKCSIDYNFADPTVYLQVLSQEHRLFNQKLRVIPLALLRDKTPNMDFTNFRLSVIHKTTETPNFTEQMNILKKEFDLKKKEIDEQRTIIQDDLNLFILPKFLNKVKIISDTLILNLENENFEFYVEGDVVPKVVTLEAIRDSVYADSNFSNICTTQFNNNAGTRCKHLKTQAQFEIRVQSKSEAITSQLLKYYLRLDPKLELFLMMIKFWADSYDLVEQDSFSDYAVCLMVIFYLQHEPYKLPAVKDLQQNTTVEVVDGWNYSYAEEFAFEDSAIKTSSFFDLVRGFFTFYSKFDYITYVVSPYFGAPVEKTNFLKPYNLPTCFQQFMSLNEDLNVNTGLYIQDVFNLSYNVSGSVSVDSMGQFTSLCRSALQLMEGGERFLLHKLFLHCQNEILVQFPCFVIEKSQGKKDDEWIQTVKTLTLKILTEMLRYKLTQIPNFNAKRVSYGCVGQEDVWNNRTSAMKIMTAPLTSINDDSEKSSETTCAVKNVVQQTCWNILVELTFADNPCSVKVIFTKKSGSCDLYHICHFVYTRLMKFLESEEQKMSDEGARVAATSSTTVPELNMCITSAASPGSSAPTEFKAVDLIKGGNNGAGSHETSTTVRESNTCETSTTPRDLSASTESETVELIKEHVNHTESHEATTENEEKPNDGAAIDTAVETPEKKENRVPNESESEEGELKDDNGEDDDVPSDFFDDFAKEDFLEGFDICDSWDPETGTSELEKADEDKKKTNGRDVKKHARSRSRTPKRHLYKRSRVKSREKSKKRKRSRSPKSGEYTRSSRSPQPCEFRKRFRRRTYSSSSASSSYSPPRKFRTQQVKRKSFLEEIKEKLDEMTKSTTPPVPNVNSLTPYGNMVQFPVNTSVSATLPVPPPLMSIVTRPPVPVFPSTSFTASPPVFYPNVPPPTFVSNNYCPVVPVGVQSYSSPHFINGSVPVLQTPLAPMYMQMPTTENASVCIDLEVVSEVQQEKSKEDSAKLFAEKKISLCDFLTLNAKRETPESLHLQKKCRVLSRCQEVIKLMTNTREITDGRFTVKESEPENKQKPKYESPFKRASTDRFNFTTPPKLSEQESTFFRTLGNILQAVGLSKPEGRTEVEGDIVETVTEKLSDKTGTDKKSVLLVLKETLLGVNSTSEEKISVGTQCIPPGETLHVGLQVGKNLRRGISEGPRFLSKKKKKKNATYRKRRV